VARIERDASVGAGKIENKTSTSFQLLFVLRVAHNRSLFIACSLVVKVQGDNESLSPLSFSVKLTKR
jgi:hypothetical protein